MARSFGGALAAAVTGTVKLISQHSFSRFGRWREAQVAAIWEKRRQKVVCIAERGHTYWLAHERPAFSLDLRLVQIQYDAGAAAEARSEVRMRLIELEAIHFEGFGI